MNEVFSFRQKNKESFLTGDMKEGGSRPTPGRKYLTRYQRGLGGKET